MNSYKGYSDKELFSLIATGDEQAFTEIYLRYTEKLYPHAARLLDSDLWAEEIVQDVFTRLWQIRDTLGAIHNPSGYLYRIAANRTLDLLKHKAVEVKMQYHIARTAEQGWVDTDKEGQVRLTAIKDAMALLSPQKVLIFRLRHQEGKTYDEIAQTLKISKNTVRNHLAEALQMIRSELIRKGILLYFYFWWKGL